MRKRRRGRPEYDQDIPGINDILTETMMAKENMAPLLSQLEDGGEFVVIGQGSGSSYHTWICSYSLHSSSDGSIYGLSRSFIDEAAYFGTEEEEDGDDDGLIDEAAFFGTEEEVKEDDDGLDEGDADDAAEDDAAEDDPSSIVAVWTPPGDLDIDSIVWALLKSAMRDSYFIDEALDKGRFRIPL